MKRQIVTISAALSAAVLLFAVSCEKVGAPRTPDDRKWKPLGEWGVVTYYADAAAMQAMSPNGQFIVGCTPFEFARVVNLAGIVQNHDPAEVDAMGKMIKYRFRDATFDPKSYFPAQFPESVVDGVWTMLGVDDWGVPRNMPATADGKTTVTYTGQPLQGGFIPIVRGPQGDEFPEIPVTFSKFDAKNYWGCTADAISTNGKTVVGRLMTTGERRITVYWQKNEAGKWQFHQSAPDQLEWGVVNEKTGQEGIAKYPSSNPGGGVSPDGRYIFGEIRQGHFIRGPYQPYYFDTQTQTTTLIPVPEGMSGRTTAISPDGTVFYFQVPVTGEIGNGGEGATQFREPMVWRNGASMSLRDYLFEKSGGTLDIEADGVEVHGYVTCAADTHLVWCDIRAEGVLNYIAMQVPEN